MLTSFSLTQLILISVAYLSTLFGIAWITERGYVPRRLVRHPLVYTLSLGVYASAWAFYGTVGLAYQYGYGFLAIYLGISGAFLLAPVLLYPILRVTRAYQLSSLADLFAFRFRSTWAGALTTLFMLIGVLPMLALQIQAVTDSISILTRDPAQERVAFVFCTLITLFAILFGARHIATRERHEGLVFAIAFESLVKLVMLGSIGLYALYGVFGGPEGLEVWLLQNQTALTTLHTPLAEGPWRTLLLVFFAAAIVMPHMFHMIFTENLNPRALISASWGLPLFLLLMSLAVPPILWAGLRLGASTTPEYYTIGLGLAVDSPALALAAFIGGISAASGLTIVMTLALSGMVLNHLVLPLYQPPAQGNIYRWLKWTRRLLIVAIIMASYAFYLLLGAEQDLSNLGIVSFVATLQFLPGALSVLYWPTANRRGFISGLIAGMLVWAITMLLPLMGNVQGLYLPLFDVIYVLDDSNWHLAALSSLAANVLVFTLVSLFTEASDEEKAPPSLRGGQRTPSATPRTVRRFAAGVRQPVGQAAGRQDRAEGGRAGPARSPPALRRTSPLCPASLARPHRGEPFRADGTQCRPGHRGDLPSLQDQRRKLRHRGHPLHREPPGGLSLPADWPGCRTRHLAPLPPADPARPADGRLLPGQGPGSADVEPRHRGTHRGRRAEGRRFAPVGLARTLEGPAGTFHRRPRRAPAQAAPGLRRPHPLAEPAQGGHRGTLAPGNSGLVLLVEDLTETQLLEDKLVHSERLASIGRLAAGVAHEIGNPITGIACLAQNLREEREGDGELTEISEQILDQTKRVSRIVQSLMSFAHSGSHLQALEPVCLSEIAQEAIGLLSLNRRSVEVEFFNLCDPAHWVEETRSAWPRC